MRGFSLLEVLVAMAISSILLLGASRFLPALQRGVLAQIQQQTLEEEVWQRLFTLAKHLQRAGYCGGERCGDDALYIARQGQCVIIRWDGDSNGAWQTAPADEADSIGFRLQTGVLETRRGATACEGGGWDKMTDPAALTVTDFQVTRSARVSLMPQLAIVLSARDTRGNRVSAQYSVTGYNL